MCDASDIFVLHAPARILVIRNSPFLVCSAHVRCVPRDPRKEAAPMAWWMELGDAVVQHRRDGEPFNAKSTGVCGGLSEAWRSSQERLHLGGDLVGSSRPRPLEENSLP